MFYCQEVFLKFLLTPEPEVLSFSAFESGGAVMKNVEMKLDGNILTIKVDLTKDFGPSSSGKTIIIASTEGNVAVDGHEEAKVGLNVYRKK